MALVDNCSDLNMERTLWVQDTDIGQAILIEHLNKKIKVTVPLELAAEKEKTLKLKGLGKSNGEKTGDLFLHVYLYEENSARHKLFSSIKSKLSYILGVNRNDTRSIWIRNGDIDQKVSLTHNNKKIMVKIPQNIKDEREITLRLKGMGKTKKNGAGDLFLHVFLNEGYDTEMDLWISDKTAKNGIPISSFVHGYGDAEINIPENSYSGLVLCINGLGKEPEFSATAPPFKRQRGDLFVKLNVYAADIMPEYGSFDSLSTDDMALEKWVYLKIAEIYNKMGKHFFQTTPIHADEIAKAFNYSGWKGIYQIIFKKLALTSVNITVNESPDISEPGRCKIHWERIDTMKNDVCISSRYKNRYEIEINTNYLDNPFVIAAIIAHELCHVICSEKFYYGKPDAEEKDKKEKLEEERFVDLLMFMSGMGEFQLRASMDKRTTFGYFDQILFNRIYFIASCALKLNG